MIHPTITDVSWMPSLQDFISHIIDDVTQERSVCVILPTSVDASEFQVALRQALRVAHLSVVDVRATALAPSEIAGMLGELLDVTWPSRYAPRTLGALLEAKGLPDVVDIGGVEDLVPEARLPWLHFVVGWAQAAQACSTRGLRTTRLVGVLPGLALAGWLPESNVRLALHWWWGIPSAIEVRLLCRGWPDDSPNGSLAAWREHLAPSLASSDVTFALDICEELDIPFCSLMDRFRALATERGWTPENLSVARDMDSNGRIISDSTKSGFQLEPPVGLRSLWACGALCFTPEYGIELHTLALALLGRDQIVRHRCWRGQAALLLPRLDLARLAICQRLTERYGRDWPVRWVPPPDPRQDDAVRDDPLACEWGHLKSLFDRWIPPSNGRDRGLVEFVTSAWLARNLLAHYQVIEYQFFEQLSRAMERLQV